MPIRGSGYLVRRELVRVSDAVGFRKPVATYDRSVTSANLDFDGLPEMAGLPPVSVEPGFPVSQVF